MNRTKTRATLRSIGATMGLTIALAACSDGTTGPDLPQDGNFDAGTAQASLNAMESVLDSPEWASFAAMSSRIGSTGVVATSVAPALESIEGLPGAGRAATRLLASASQIPLISSGNLGVTFAIDPGTGEYAPDPTRSDAPSNGVRFVLYELFPGTEDPDLSNEIGHLDLVDNGAGIPGIDLRLSAFANGFTFIDYGVALEGDESSGMVSIDGFVTDDVDRLDFDFDVAATDDGSQQTIDLDATLSVATHGLSVTVNADGTSFDEDDGSLTAAVNVAYGDESLAVDMTGSEASVDAEFRINGALFATATGDPDAPVVLGADGNELSSAEILVLGHIIETTEEVFDFFEELVEPAEGIILLAAIL